MISAEDGEPPLGREPVHALLDDLLDPVVDRPHVDLVVGPLGIVVEGRYTGTNTGPLATPAGEVPATGRSMVLPFADVFRITDGRIAEHRIYYDGLGLLAQLGLLPEPTSA